MQNDAKDRTLQALFFALKPLVRALLRAGIGYRQMAELCKSTYVEIATQHYGQHGRPTNRSRVAAMTGLTRREVSRLRDKAAAGEETADIPPTPMESILHHWHTATDFLNESGRPRELHFDSGTHSFSELVRKYTGDIPPGAMRAELRRIDAIVNTADGCLRVVKRNVSESDIQDSLISGLNGLLYPAALALANGTDKNNDGRWFHGTAITNQARKNDVPRLNRISRDRLRECVETIEALYTAYETLYADEEEGACQGTVGVAVFCFEATEFETPFGAGGIKSGRQQES